MPDPGNIYELLMGSEPDAKMQAKALADRIRGQRAFGAFGALAQPGGIAHFSEALGGQAKQDQDLLEKGAVARLHYGPEALGQKFSAALDAIRARNEGALQGIGARNEGALDRANIGADAKRYASDMALQGRLAGIEARIGKDATSETDKAIKAWRDFSTKFTPGIASSRNPMGVNQRIIDSTTRLKALAESNKFLDKQEVREMAASMASIVMGGQGGTMARKTIEDFTPSTFKGDVAGWLQYVNNHPTDTQSQEFVKRFIRTANREAENAKINLRKTIVQGGIANRDLIAHPAISETAHRWLKNAGLTDDQIAYIKGERDDAPVDELAPPPGASSRPKRTDPATGETREWDGAKWVPIGGK